MKFIDSKLYLSLATLVLGLVVVAVSRPSLSQQGLFEFEPNPGALAGSPFGRTIGIGMQGPVLRVWDRGLGGMEGRADRAEGGLIGGLFNHVTALGERKAAIGDTLERSKDYERFALAKVEHRLERAWKMDPRNFANYALYQMFLFEDFSGGMVEKKMSMREMSLATLDACEVDQGSPVTTLTAAQASYDLVFDAWTSPEMTLDEKQVQIRQYTEKLENLLTEYKALVAEWKENGRWDDLSTPRKEDFQLYIERLSFMQQDSRQKLEQTISSASVFATGKESVNS